MATDTEGLRAPSTRVVLKVALFYAVMLGAGSLAWAWFQRESASSVPLAVAGAMVVSVMLSLPVAWVYLLTRAKRGYQQSVVQLLLILPLVVSGVVLLVKDSVPLAFSLAGIVAAVRFRNTLDDSKDAVYVFLATGIGLASAVNLPVAVVISVVFNVTVLLLWYTDFGHAPVELEGRIANMRLQRARQLAKTGTFVARMDDEVLRNMTKEQLEGLAQLAWNRSRGAEESQDLQPSETRLRLRTREVDKVRSALEPRLGEHAKKWRFGGQTALDDNIFVLDYFVKPKKKSEPEDLLILARVVAGAEILDADVA